ncbi:MAG: NADPH-dependent FMN reductase [Woeseiaceae bacterium]
MTLNTAVVYGSARRGRQGIKAARFVVNQLEARDHAVDLIDTSVLELPMLDLMYKEYAEGEAPAAMESVAEIFRNADGFIILSAEYNHSVPAALKNLLDTFQSEYLYKPSGLVTYSAGPFGGVRALVNLRGIMAELGAPSIPSAFPISKVYNAFDDDGNVLDTPYDKRIEKFLDEYEWYANALKAARQRDACESAQPLQQTMCRGVE